MRLADQKDRQEGPTALGLCIRASAVTKRKEYPLELNMAKTKKQNPASTLYVASNLEFWITEEPHIWADKVTIYGKQYVRLTPEVIDWFKEQIHKAEIVCDARKLPVEEYGHLIRAFCPVYEFAVRTGMIPDPVNRANNDEQTG
jgi:hypothetical protein